MYKSNYTDTELGEGMDSCNFGGKVSCNFYDLPQNLRFRASP